jgi:enoyl-CoA hydratase/carnithine racemase
MVRTDNDVPILVQAANGVLGIRINRPAKKNALTGSMYGLMADAIVRADADPAILAVLFSGNGDCFTAGNDLSDFLANPPLTGDSPPERFLNALSGARKVLVAAVHGAVTGIGTTMLLHCDFVIAGHSASLSMPFVKLGLVPEAGSSLLLPRLIGHLRAMEMLLLGEAVDARTAHELGLVNRVVDDATLLPTARALAETVAALPPAAVLQTKALLKLNTTDLNERMSKELLVFDAQLRSAAFREIATAFLEKRNPDVTIWKS